MDYDPQETKRLVLAAQQQDLLAINQLCTDYAPLIYKLTRAPSVYGVLGEDGINLGFVILLELIQGYKDIDKWETFPGYLRTELYYRLKDALYKKDPLDFSDSTEELGEETHYLSSSPIEQENENLVLHTALQKLSASELNAVQGYYLNGYTLDELATASHRSKSTISRNLDRGLRRLRANLNVLS